MATLDPQYPGGQSNIKGSRGVPIKRQGPGLRDAMRGYDVPLRDRVKARNLDQQAAKAGWRQSPGLSEAAGGTLPVGPAPATGNNLNSRQLLHREMESAGADGITPQMRTRARDLGVTDEQFNGASAKIRENGLYAPGTATPAANPSPPASASPTQPGWKEPPVIAAKPEQRVNSLTGMPFNTLPGDAGYNPNWRTAMQTPAPAVPSPVVAGAPAAPTESPLVQQARQIKEMKDGVEALRPSLGAKPPVQTAAATPAAPVASPPVAQNVAPIPAPQASPAWKQAPQPAAPAAPLAPPTAPPAWKQAFGVNSPAATPSPSQPQAAAATVPAPTPSAAQPTAMTTEEEVLKANQAKADQARQARRAQMKQATAQMNAQVTIPDWMEGTKAGGALRWLQQAR